MLSESIRAAVTTGFPTTSGGQRHSSDTPTNESISPSSAIISVALGRNEQIRTQRLSPRFRQRRGGRPRGRFAPNVVRGSAKRIPCEERAPWND